MSDIFELIMGNMFVVIIIIGVLIKMFSSSKAKQNERNNEQQNERQNENPNENKPPSVFQQVKSEIEKQKQAQTSENQRRQQQTTTQPEPAVSQAVVDQREAQLNRLKKNNQTSSSNADNPHSGMQNRPKVTSQEITDDSIGEIKLSKRLTQKGLIESVVMAEVLGSPRALKPYRSVSSNRYR